MQFVRQNGRRGVFSRVDTPALVASTKCFNNRPPAEGTDVAPRLSSHVLVAETVAVAPVRTAA